ncbi:hypothetical protein PL373_14480 [Tenacibaculum maritimum]|nr:hypothetical protein [Tenacibaculum maritimum]MDB0602325.1 hypothetical protein [Tenacibaculum maritimum]MDB0612461.1 hypothetical protein [Tenacibaculum maritimum]
MSTITIKSGKISNGMFLHYSFEEKKPESTDTVNKKSDLPIHVDCQVAYNNLIPHLMLLCEQEPISDEIRDSIENGVGDIHDEESYFKNYRVTEFKITGSANSEGVVLSGTRYLSTGKTISLATPFIRWDNEDYKDISELAEAVENVREEVYQYYKGKHAPLPKQESFDFDEKFEDEPIDSLKEIGEKFKKNMKDAGVTVEVSTSK